MKLLIKKAITSKIIRIFIQDSSFSDGRGLAGLVYNTPSLSCYYSREGASSATQVNLVTATAGSYTSSGFVELDATNMPGWYELHLPDAVFASGADSVAVHLKGATNMAAHPIEIQLVSLDPGTALPTFPANFSSLAIDSSGNMTTLVSAIRTGTAQGGASGSITLDSGANANNGFYTGCEVLITSSTGVGQVRLITGYTGSSKIATVSPNWTTNPTSSSVFAILPVGRSIIDTNNDKAAYSLAQAFPVNFSSLAINGTGKIYPINVLRVDQLAQAGAASTITLDASASTITDFYKDQIITLTDGTGLYQSRLITGYNGSTKVATIIPNWSINPDSTSVYCITAKCQDTLTTNAIADAILTRAISVSEGSATVPCLHWAVAALCNKSDIGTPGLTSATLTVYKDDGIASLFAKTLTLASGVNPITAQTKGA